MTFKVGTYSYDISRAEQTITATSKQFYIYVIDATINIEEMYDNISPIIATGFSIIDTETQTFTGYTVSTIRKNFDEEGISSIFVELMKYPAQR